MLVGELLIKSHKVHGVIAITASFAIGVGWESIVARYFFLRPSGWLGIAEKSIRTNAVPLLFRPEFPAHRLLLGTDAPRARTGHRVRGFRRPGPAAWPHVRGSLGESHRR